MTPLDTAAVARATAGEPAWRAEARRDALRRVEGRALPSSKDEMWKYVDLDFDLADYRLVDEPGPVPGPGEVLAAAPGMTVVDGIAAEVDLTATPVTDGATVLRLADAIASGHPGLDTLFAPSLAA
ncbi:MAG: hypothetical protein ABWY62_07670, partial [Acidimicrobiia bacterium]